MYKLRQVKKYYHDVLIENTIKLSLFFSNEHIGQHRHNCHENNVIMHFFFFYHKGPKIC